MEKRKPAKPTDPFGHFLFSKSGKVTKVENKLSSDKDLQERGVAEIFVDGLKNHHPEIQVTEVVDLPENDHDVLLKTINGPITLQITEIRMREYAHPITKEEYNSGKYRKYIQMGYGEISWAVDEDKYNDVLRLAIQRKVEKHYAKSPSKVLWLLVFSTSAFVKLVYCEGERFAASTLYENAVEYAENLSSPVFDRIWFTNLQTRPISVFPKDMRF